MVFEKRILILEDDLRTVGKIVERLGRLEDRNPCTFSFVILANYLQVENYINNNPKAEFDIILLNRDCGLGGSFHILDLERFGAHKVIAISSVPDFNEQLKKRGVTKIVQKDYGKIDDFADKLEREIEKML